MGGRVVRVMTCLGDKWSTAGVVRDRGVGKGRVGSGREGRGGRVEIFSGDGTKLCVGLRVVRVILHHNRGFGCLGLSGFRGFKDFSSFGVFRWFGCNSNPDWQVNVSPSSNLVATTSELQIFTRFPM